MHPVNAALLAAGGGRYRCGKCSKINNAFESLFDQWPAPGAKPPPPGEVPVLAAGLDLDSAARARRFGNETENSDDEEVSKGPAWPRLLLRLGWIVAMLVIAVFVVFGIAEFQGKPLLERPQVRAALESMGLSEPPPVATFRDLDRIHLVSRELRNTPGRPGWLRLSATIVNRASRSQPWPDLEITLLDASGETVTQQLVKPADYLSADSDRNRGMAPQAYLPLVVELEDPGRRAVGFELEFR